MSRDRTPALHAGYLVLVVTLVAVLATSSSAAVPPRPAGSNDLVSSAQPTENRPLVRDRSTTLVRTADRAGTSDAVATASAACAGCRGHARTVQIVVRRHSGHASVDNIATAWASCAGCRSTALSVQVALVQDRGTVVANNRALALTARCTGCLAWAAAYQVVLVNPERGGLRALRRDVLEWVGEIPVGQAAPAGTLGRTPQPRRGAVQRLRDLERLVEARSSGRVVDSSVDVDQ